MSSPEHPERRKLAEYVSGALAEADSSVVARHLAECPECETTIQQIEAKSDTMLTGLRKPPPNNPYVQEEEFRRAAKQAAALPGAAPAATPGVDQPSAVSTKAPTPKLGPYKLLTKLGEGGMGAVFKAQHEHLEKLVAIKVLPKKAMNDKGAVERFRREMKAVGRLHHPNIVVAFDAGEFQGVHYLVMEYVEGCDLSTLIKKQGPLTLECATSYVLQAARGLAFAHSKGIVHRDIKPANLLVDGEGTVKILDMGLARLDDGSGANAEANQGLTQTGQVMGTVDYMAPEQAFDTHRADAKADVYSLGCTLYRILTGENAFRGDTVVQKILAHRENPIPSLSKLRAESPAALDELHQRMMAKKPEDRPTMAEVVTALEALSVKPQASDAAAPSIIIDVSKDATVGRAPGLAASLATRAAAHAKPQPKSSGGRSKPPVKLIAIGLGGFAILCLGIILYVNGSKVEVPEGSDVKVTQHGTRTEVHVTLPAASTVPGAASADGIATVGTTGPAHAETAEPRSAVSPFDAAQARALQAAWAAYLGTTVETKNGIGMRMTLLPPGEFLMGSTPEQVEAAKKMGEADKILPNDAYYSTMPGEMPQHPVRIRRPLLMSATEVTVAEFRKFAESAKYVTTSERYGFGDGFGDDKQFARMSEAQKNNAQGLNWRAPRKIDAISDEHPATQVTWDDAVAFCNWLSEQEGRRPWYRPDGKGGWLFAAYADADGYRLPTEAEWEYACRAGTTTHYSFGDDQTQMERYGWFSEESGNRMGPVALKRPNPFGLFDMHGNAQEWCHDIYDAKFYEKSPTDDPAATVSSGYARAVRGGHLFRRAADARSAYRGYANSTNHRNWYMGFRIVRLLEPQASVAIPRVAAPLTDVNSPAFQAWLKATQALPAEQQIEAVSKKLMELNPGFDGKVSSWKDTSGAVGRVYLVTDDVADLAPLRAFTALKIFHCSGSGIGKGRLVDLSPLKGMQLATLDCGFSKVSDLSPLEGMPLTSLKCGITAVSDLSPLRGMPLRFLSCSSSPVVDLAPLAGMPLTSLDCYGTYVADLSPLKGMTTLTNLTLLSTRVTDLSPIQGMNLTSVGVSPKNITAGMDVLRGMKSLTIIAPKPGMNLKAEEFWKRYDAGEFNAASNTATLNDPAFQQWVKDTQKLPAEQQLEAVSKKLMELNPGFDGKLTESAYGAKNGPKIEKGVVVDLGLLTDHVENLAPLRALSGLKRLNCRGSIPRQGRLVDLSPLAGLSLTNLSCEETQVADLSPLKGMPLKALACQNTSVADLTPLVGMQLVDVRIFRTNVSDLAPLKGMKLGILYCHNTPVSDLSPLAGMPLTALNCSDSQVSDLTPLKGMQLPSLWFHDTLVSDVTPLEGMPLKSLRFTPANITRGIDVLRSMTTLQDLGLIHATNGVGVYTPAEFWKKYDAGEFAKSTTTQKLAYLDPKFQQWVKDTQKLPAEKQLEEVSKKLMELNPGFDAVFTGYSRKDTAKIENGVVTELGFISDYAIDLSPVRALAGLKALNCGGTSPSSGSLSDLSPLGGMPLTKLGFGSSKVSDLSPLRGMQLSHLDFHYSQVSDLSPLEGMPLDYLNCGGSPRLSDLSPLKRTALTNLICSNSKELSSLAPLQGMRLTSLGCSLTQVADLSPLTECKELKSLSVSKTKVTADQVAALQKALPDCKIVWDDPAKQAIPQPAASGTK